MLLIHLNKWLWVEIWNFHFWKTSEDKVVIVCLYVCFYGGLEWSISWPRRNIWCVAFSHNINFYDPAVFLTYYLAIFILFGIIFLSVSMVTGESYHLVLLTLSQASLLQKKKKKVKEWEITTEVLYSWKYKNKISCKCSRLQFHT